MFIAERILFIIFIVETKVCKEEVEELAIIWAVLLKRSQWSVEIVEKAVKELLEYCRSSTQIYVLCLHLRQEVCIWTYSNLNACCILTETVLF